MTKAKKTRIIITIDKIKENQKLKSKKEKRYKCEYCGKKSKVYRLFDIDGTNLEEALVCLNCRDGQLSYTYNTLNF